MTTPIQLNQLNAMVEEIEDYAILMLDTKGTVLNWNRGAQKIKGYAAEEIIGKNFEIFYLQNDKDTGLPIHLLQQATEKGKAEHVGWRVKKDGNTFWGSILITALHDAEGNVIGFTKVTRDLTTHRLLEESRQAYLTELEQHSQEIEQLTYITSHDLQEPLRTIKGIINLLREKKEIQEDTESEMLISFIGDSVERMHRLVKAVLEYSLLGNNKEKSEVDCNELVRDIITDLAGVIGDKAATIQCGTLPLKKDML
ncbi:MAG: PAS domain S-box protein [Williamsia sp.]|nr:PAS domain S-box protein [Williamsia sp.]